MLFEVSSCLFQNTLDLRNKEHFLVKVVITEAELYEIKTTNVSNVGLQ